MVAKEILRVKKKVYVAVGEILRDKEIQVLKKKTKKWGIKV